MVRKILGWVFGVFTLLGFVCYFFRTDFGIDKWFPSQLGWVLAIVIGIWWIGFFIWIGFNSDSWQ